MSGIAGLWTFGRPLDAASLAAFAGMSAAIAHRGRDGSRQWTGPQVIIGHHALWTTDEEVGEGQPLLGASGAVVAMDGRLDNRDELQAACSLPPQASDAGLALAAYERWGRGFAEHLNGDFAVAVFDPARDELLLARDAIGVRPLYYTRAERFFAFASEIKALLAHPDVPTRPDAEGLADYLLVSSRPVDRLEVTCFDGILALPPSHLAIATPASVSTRRYWDFDPARQIRFKTTGEYEEAFRERFAVAVKRRMRSSHPVAVAVSGGLDSSSIFCQALTAGARAFGITHPGASGTPADEARYVEKIEKKFGVAIERFTIEDRIGVLETMEEQVRAGEAPMMDYMWPVLREVHSRAAARGARVLVTGAWGDQVFFSAAYLVDLFNRLRWLTIARHLREYRRWVGDSEAQVLARRFVTNVGRHYVPRAVVPPVKWVRRTILGVERPKPWFADAFLKNALRFAGQPATLGDGFHSANARAVYFEARSKYHVHILEWHDKSAALFGLNAAFPVLDRDLIALLMAIPGEMQAMNGQPRSLLRAGMRGILPDEIRARPTKADFTYIVNAGMARDAGAIAGFLAPTCKGVQLRYFDPVQLPRTVHSLTPNLAREDAQDAWDLADALGLEVWLRLFLAHETIDCRG